MRPRTALILAATAAAATWFFWLLVPVGKDPLAVPLLRGWYGYRPEVEEAFNRFFRTRDTIRAYESQLVAYDMRDRAESRRAAAPDELVVVADAGVTDANRTYASAVLTKELAALGVTRPAAPIHVILSRAEPRTTYPAYRRTVVIPSEATRPCVVVLVALGPSRPLFIQGYDRLLGTCGFYAVYGAPGKGMIEWLRTTRGRRAGFLQFPEYVTSARIEDPAAVNDIARAPFIAPCLRRVTTACDSLFMGAVGTIGSFGAPRNAIDVGAPAPGVLVGSPELFRGNSTPVTFGLLASLAQDLGPERFARLWKSDDPLPVAYAVIAGHPVAEGVREMLDRRMISFESGPSVRAAQWLATLVVLFLAASLGLTIPKRRLS